MSTLTLAPVTVIFTGDTINDVYEQITQYVAKNTVKLLDSSPAPKASTLPVIPKVTIPVLTPDELFVQDLKDEAEHHESNGNTENAKEYKKIINNINARSPVYPYYVLISNKKNEHVYTTLFDSIRRRYYNSREASATQKEKNRKAAIVAALEEKYNSYPPEKSFQRDAYKYIINDIKHLPSNTDSMIYHNLKGVGDSISNVISNAYKKYN